MVVQIIGLSPPLNELNLNSADFDAEGGEAICEALTISSLPTLCKVSLQNHRSWFDSDNKCEAWVAAFIN